MPRNFDCGFLSSDAVEKEVDSALANDVFPESTWPNIPTETLQTRRPRRPRLCSGGGVVDGEDIIPQQSKSFSSGEMYSIAFIARFLFCCLFSLLSFLYLNSSFQFFFKIRVVVREGKRVLSKNASSLRGDLLRPTMTTRSLVLGDEEVFSLTLSLSLCFSLFVSDNSFVSSQKKNCLCLPLCVSLSLLFSSLLSSLSFFLLLVVLRAKL